MGESLAVLLDVHLGTTIPQSEIQRIGVSAGLQARLTRQLDALWVGRLVRSQCRTFILKVGVDICVGGDIVRSLNELQSKTAVNVPGNVTVHEPGTRVVSLETNDCVASGVTRTCRTLKHDSIATSRVVEVQSADQITGECASASAEDGHIMTVNVQRMRSKELVLDDKVDPYVGLVENEGIADKIVGATFGEGLESRLAVVDVHDSVVDIPVENCTVVVGCNLGDRSSRDCGHRCRERIAGASRLLEVWHQRSKRLILANIGSDVGNRGVVDRSDRIGALVVDDGIGRSKTRVGAARRASGLDDSTDVVAAWDLVSLNNDFVSLTVGNVESGSLVGHDGHEIRRDNSHGVRVEANDPAVLSGAAQWSIKFSALGAEDEPVDDAEQVLSARLETPREWRTTRTNCVGVLVLSVEQGVE